MALSLIASFISAIKILGVPADVKELKRVHLDMHFEVYASNAK